MSCVVPPVPNLLKLCLYRDATIRAHHGDPASHWFQERSRWLVYEAEPNNDASITDTFHADGMRCYMSGQEFKGMIGCSALRYEASFQHLNGKSFKTPSTALQFSGEPKRILCGIMCIW